MLRLTDVGNVVLWVVPGLSIMLGLLGVALAQWRGCISVYIAQAVRLHIDSSAGEAMGR